MSVDIILGRNSISQTHLLLSDNNPVRQIVCGVERSSITAHRKIRFTQLQHMKLDLVFVVNICCTLFNVLHSSTKSKYVLVIFAGHQ